jgi:hypothetical protein
MRTTRHEPRKLSRDQGEDNQQRLDDVGPIAIAVNLASGIYAGPAVLIDRRLMKVEFPWSNAKRHQCLISSRDVTDWKNVRPTLPFVDPPIRDGFEQGAGI